MKRTLPLFFILLLAGRLIMAQTMHATSILNDGTGSPDPGSSVGLIINPETDVMSAWALPGLGATSGNTRCPGNTFNYQRTEYLIRPSEMSASGFPSGFTIDAIGFLIQTAGVTTHTGNFKVYLKNTSDIIYSLGANWTTTGFTLVSDIASWTVPISAGSYVVNFSGGTPFTYSGGGVYVAWEFSNPGTVGTGALIANCNTSLAAGLYGQRSVTAMPTTLAASDWRPATLFANNSLTDVLQVTNIYAQEKCPVPYGVPTSLTARVANISASAQTFDVTVTITDQTTSAVRYTNTQTVTALAGGAASVVTFTPWTASLLENDNVTVTIPVAAGETYTVNNTKVIPVNVNNNLYGLCYALNPSTGYGFTYTGAGGIFANKFHMNGSGTVPGANLFIYNYAANTGNTVYAVVINSAGVIVAQSDNLVIAAGDLGTNKNFTFLTPPPFTNEDFYVGLAQPTGGTVQWYPMGCMSESPYRTGTYYSFAITGGTPGASTVDYKYMIEAQVAPASLLAHDAGTVSVEVNRVITSGVYIPKATVKNYGANTESFDVTMTTAGYSSTKSVTSLASGAYIQVTFDPWTNSLGDYTFNVCTALAGDLDATNDCKTQAVKVLNLNKQVYGYNAFAGSGTDPVGPTAFNLATPGTLNSLADQSLLQFVNGGTWANGMWYGTVYNTVAPYDFITIDPVTGTRTVIGDMGMAMNGLSFNKATGIMYGVTGTSLYSINMGTGLPTLIGANTGINMINLAINSAGQAYTVDVTNDLFGTIDLATGLFTIIGPIGFNANYAQDMEFDRETEELYIAAHDLSIGWLGWVNLTTGAVLRIGDFEGGGEITGFAIPYSFVPEFTEVTGTVTGEETTCYNATNTITVAGASPFNVEIGGSVTFIAGVKISFMPGVSIPAGASMHGYISSGSYCGGAPAMPAVVAGTDPASTNSIDQVNFSIFPNPTSGNFTLVQKGDRKFGDVKVEVYGMHGAKVLVSKMIGEKQHEFVTSQLPVGIYFVKVIADDYTETIKLVKTR